MSHPQNHERIIEHSIFETIRHYAESPDSLTEEEMRRTQHQIDDIIAYQDATICGSGIQILKHEKNGIQLYDAGDLIPTYEYDWYNDRFYPKLHNVVVEGLKKVNDTVVYEGAYSDDHDGQIHKFIAPVRTSELCFYNDLHNDFIKEYEKSIKNINCIKTKNMSQKIYMHCEREIQEKSDHFGFMNLIAYIKHLNPDKTGDTQAYLEHSCYTAFFHCDKLTLESRQVDYREHSAWVPSLAENNENITVVGTPIAVFFDIIQPTSSEKIFIPYVFLEDDQKDVVRIPFQKINDMEMIYE